MGRVRYATRNIMFGLVGSAATTILNFVLRQVFIMRLGDTPVSYTHLSELSCISGERLQVDGRGMQDAGNFYRRWIRTEIGLRK